MAQSLHPTPWFPGANLAQPQPQPAYFWASKFLEFGAIRFLDLQIPASATGPDHITG